MKAKRITLAIVLVLICVLLTACSTPEGTYKQAQTLLSQGKYSEAAEKFESLGSYEDASTLTMYCKACALCESGNFEAGIAGFESLGNYKDCSLRISYYTARSWDDNSVGTTEFEWMNRAKSIYNENPLYLDSAERITALDARIESAKKTLYDNAIAAAEQGQYSTAIATFQRLGNYKDSAQRATYYGIRADEEALAGTTNETAYDAVAVRYTNMGSYLDCADRAAAVTAQATAIRDDKYDAAVALMNEGKYSEAITAFTAIKSYKDSATKIQACETAIKDAKYDAAVALMNEGRYNEAITAFTAIRSYKDSAVQIKECNYLMAKNLLQNGYYSGAYSIFLTLQGYKDVDMLLASDDNLKAVARDAMFAVGNYVFFGKYPQTTAGNDDTPIEWLVLARDGDNALLISRYALDCKAYHSSMADITWEDCSLRQWLNADFMNKAFSKSEQSGILTTYVTAEKNPGYSTDPGNATQDKVFLLSKMETQKLFPNYSDRVCEATPYAIQQGVATLGRSVCNWWLLRTPGHRQEVVSCVDGGGVIQDESCIVFFSDTAVRPAVWVNIESGIF